MFILRWLTSPSVRQALDLSQQARKILASQRDILAPGAVAAMEKAIAGLNDDARSGSDKKKLDAQMSALEEAAAKWLKPYPFAGVRENVEMFLVTTSVILAVFTFFVQHFAIPTGSMQPTLYGVTATQNQAGDASFSMPGFFGRIYERWIKGVSYVHLVAANDGSLQSVEDPKTVLPFVKRQRFQLGDTWQTLWFPPTDDLPNRAGLVPGHPYKAGEEIIKMKVTAGDHLLVDRLTYNFRPPTRGEIIIFSSTGIPLLIQNTYYIKRLIALSNEKVRVGDDRHVVINGKRLDASTPHFENLYTFGPTAIESTYSGHVNQKVAFENHGPSLAPLFPDGSAEYTVRPNHFLVMGDNTMNSFDSRGWGDFPREKVIGKAFFVFWPITSRVGWSNH